MATATDRQKTNKEGFPVPDSGERKVSLLVVEDDENISTAISEYFSRAGYNVKTVEDGLNGVKAALDDPPDAVVLDLMLPKMDGLAVCKELREKVGRSEEHTSELQSRLHLVCRLLLEKKKQLNTNYTLNNKQQHSSAP